MPNTAIRRMTSVWIDAADVQSHQFHLRSDPDVCLTDNDVIRSIAGPTNTNW
jgi:hypothetical protein